MAIQLTCQVKNVTAKR